MRFFDRRAYEKGDGVDERRGERGGERPWLGYISQPLWRCKLVSGRACATLDARAADRMCFYFLQTAAI